MTKLIWGVVGTIVVLALFALLSPFKMVKAGTVGLVYKWNAVQEETLEQGFHWRTPIKERIQTVDMTVQGLEYQVPVGDDGAITADNQTIGADTALYYRWQRDRLVEVVQNEGFDSIRVRLRSALKQSFKEGIGQYTIFEVATNQEEIRNKVWERLNEITAEYPVEVTELRIENYDWSQEFDNQIETTMQRAQQVKQAEQDLLVTEQNAQKIVKNAEAKKKESELLAEAKALEGEGIRKYNTSVQQNMALEIQLRQLFCPAPLEVLKFLTVSGRG